MTNSLLLKLCLRKFSASPLSPPSRPHDTYPPSLVVSHRKMPGRWLVLHLLSQTLAIGSCPLNPVIPNGTVPRGAIAEATLPVLKLSLETGPCLEFSGVSVKFSYFSQVKMKDSLCLFIYLSPGCTSQGLLPCLSQGLSRQFGILVTCFTVPSK